MPATNTVLAALTVIVTRTAAGEVVDITESDAATAQTKADALQWENYDEVAYDLRKARKYPTYKGEITERRYFTVATVTSQAALRHIAMLEANIAHFSQDEADIATCGAYDAALFAFLSKLV